MIFVRNLRKTEISFPGTGVSIGRGKTELSPESYGKIKNHKLFTTLRDAGLITVEEPAPEKAPAKKRVPKE